MHDDEIQFGDPRRHYEGLVSKSRLYDSDGAEDLRDFEEPEHSHEGHITTSETVGNSDEHCGLSG